jgi:hypothetical protein
MKNSLQQQQQQQRGKTLLIETAIKSSAEVAHLTSVGEICAEIQQQRLYDSEWVSLCFM